MFSVNIFIAYLLKRYSHFSCVHFKRMLFKKPGRPCGRPRGINLRPSPSTAVAARAVGSGREGLYGRPRPVHLASILRNTTTPHPAGDHKGPPNPTSSSLAPTDRSASWLTSRLRLMRIGQPRRSPNTHQPHQHPSSSNKDTTRCNQFSTV